MTLPEQSERTYPLYRVWVNGTRRHQQLEHHAPATGPEYKVPRWSRECPRNGPTNQQQLMTFQLGSEKSALGVFFFSKNLGQDFVKISVPNMDKDVCKLQKFLVNFHTCIPLLLVGCRGISPACGWTVSLVQPPNQYCPWSHYPHRQWPPGRHLQPSENPRQRLLDGGRRRRLRGRPRLLLRGMARHWGGIPGQIRGGGRVGEWVVGDPTKHLESPISPYLL